MQTIEKCPKSIYNNVYVAQNHGGERIKEKYWDNTFA